MGHTASFDMVDRFKRMAQEVAARSTNDISRFDMKFVEWTRGESVQLYEGENFYIAHVNEGLGTKNMVADKMYYHKWHSYDRNIGKCTFAMIANDMVSLGAMPIGASLHIVAGSERWFHNPEGWEDRCREFLEGWLEACTEARCRFDGGETPIPSGNVRNDTAVLSGSAIGIISPKSRLIRRNIQVGDSIVLLGSSGIHANGLTFARKISEQLTEGYCTKMSDGRMFGEALLDPTHIYVRFVEDCLNAGIEIHYCSNITGHGWRKIMRAPEPFLYEINNLPHVHPVFDFIAEKGSVSVRDMYADYNMGAGFALFIPAVDVQRISTLYWTRKYPFSILRAGNVQESAEKKLLIRPLGIEFGPDELQVR